MSRWNCLVYRPYCAFFFLAFISLLLQYVIVLVYVKYLNYGYIACPRMNDSSLNKGINSLCIDVKSRDQSRHKMGERGLYTCRTKYNRLRIKCLESLRCPMTLSKNYSFAFQQQLVWNTYFKCFDNVINCKTFNKTTFLRNFLMLKITKWLFIDSL